MGETITSLIEKLEGAEVGSRELDARVWASVNGYELFEHDGAGWRYRMRPDDIMRHERTGYISPTTTSLDAALALAERVLPGWYAGVQANRRHQMPDDWTAYLAPPEVGREFDVSARTPAIALCAALLLARSEARV